MSKQVSILLPVYNGAKYLRTAIQSVLDQTWDDFELIICDDISTDNSFDIAEKFALFDSRIKLKKNPTRLGLFENYNQCRKIATGHFIKPFAQDDLLYPTYLENGFTILSSHPEITLFLSARNLLDSNDLTTETISPLHGPASYDGSQLILWSLIFLTNRLGEPVVGMFRACDIDYLYDTRYFHFGDLELWFRLLQKGKLFYDDKVLCAFRVHDSSTTSTNHKHLLDLLDAIRISRQYFSYLAAIGESEDHMHKRLIESFAVTAAHLQRVTNSDSSIVRRHGPQNGPNGVVKFDDDFAEILYLSLLQFGPLQAELDLMRRNLVELNSLRAQLNTRSHKLVGRLMTFLKSGRILQ